MLKGFLCAMVMTAGLCGPGATAQGMATGQDAFASLGFLEGSWSAHGSGQGASSDGAYTFRRELGGHILARHAQVAGCKGPAQFDCEHGDLLYIYPDAPGQPLKAIYFDNEGHVIHYGVSVPEPGSVVFLSEGAGGGPQFRLMYTFRNGSMAGSFAMQMPGQTAWRPYLEWTGAKQTTP